jgi:hypothetical protein
VQLDTVVAVLNILLVLVLGFSGNFEDEDEEDGLSSTFSAPVNNRVKRHPIMRGDEVCPFHWQTWGVTFEPIQTSTKECFP